MKAVILAGGFATRLGKLGFEVAKPLINICGKPAIQWIIDELRQIELKEIILTVNLKFENQFRQWVSQQDLAIKLVVEPSLRNEEKPGATRALLNVLDENDDYLIVAGDNIFTGNLEGMVKFYEKIRKPVIAVVKLEDAELIRQYSVVELDSQKRVRCFIEKPQNPTSSLVGACIYVIPGWCKRLIETYLAHGGDPDSPGKFIEWLVNKVEVYGFELGGKWIDIGNLEALALAKKMFEKG